MVWVVSILCACGGLSHVAFAFFAFRQQHPAQNAATDAAVSLGRAAEKRFEVGWPEESDELERAYADLPAAAELTRALGEVGGQQSARTPPVAALAISVLLFLLAAGLAVVGELHR